MITADWKGVKNYFPHETNLHWQLSMLQFDLFQSIQLGVSSGRLQGMPPPSIILKYDYQAPKYDDNALKYEDYDPPSNTKIMFHVQIRRSSPLSNIEITI